MSLSDYFETKQRSNGGQYTRLRNDAPAWLHEAVHEAHGEALPDDWTFRTCENICERIDEGITDPAEIAEDLADIYTSSLLEWYRDDLDRTYYADQCLGEGEFGTLSELLMAGQTVCLQEMAAVLVAAYNENGDEDDDLGEDDEE